MTRKLTEGKLYHADFDRFGTWTTLAAPLVPVDFELAEVQDKIFQNGAAVIRLRYTRKGAKSVLYGEHFSLVYRKKDQELLGFVDLRLENVVLPSDKLPSKEETRKLAHDFSRFFDAQENLWIDQHGENIKLNGEKMTVAGTKYKCFMSSTGPYAWVVFGKEKNAIIFEREIEWVNGRTTEKWLHDTYLEIGKLDFVPVRHS